MAAFRDNAINFALVSVGLAFLLSEISSKTRQRHFINR